MTFFKSYKQSWKNFFGFFKRDAGKATLLTVYLLTLYNATAEIIFPELLKDNPHYELLASVLIMSLAIFVAMLLFALLLYTIFISIPYAIWLHYKSSKHRKEKSVMNHDDNQEFIQ